MTDDLIARARHAATYPDVSPISYRLVAELADALEQAQSERDAIARAEAVHEFVPARPGIHADACKHCAVPWPCATVRALRG